MLEVSLSSGFMLSLFRFVILLFTGNALIDTYLCSVAVVTQSCLTLATPWTHQAPLSIEFSRQEYWSGLPFPSPGDLPDPELKPRSPALLPDSLLTELQGKLKNTGVDYHFLLQGVFPTQNSNPGLLHYRQILY